MVLELTMICIDYSERMKNGDYAPNKFLAQANVVNLICGAKTQLPRVDPNDPSVKELLASMQNPS